MKSVKIISYDLKGTTKDYSNLINSIKEYGSWWHYLESFWLLYTDKSVSELTENLTTYLDKEDRMLIIDTLSNSYNGWLPQKAYDWISERIDHTKKDD